MKEKNEYIRVPENPLKISAAGRRIYNRIWRILNEADRLQPGDEYNLTLLCEALADYDDCRKQLNKNGKFVTTGENMIRVHPAWTAQNDCLKSIKELSGLFKLAPKHRDRSENVSSTEDPMDMINAALDGWKKK